MRMSFSRTVSVSDPEFVVSMLGVFVTSGLSYRLSKFMPMYCNGKRVLPEESGKILRRIEATDRIVLIPYSIIQGILAVLGTMKLKDDWYLRWHETCPVAKWCITLYVVKTGIFDVSTHVATLHTTEKKRFGILLHHIFSGLCMGIAIFYSGTCHYFACLAIISETSTFFLNNIMLTKLFTGERTQFQSAFVSLNGILLWFSYIFCRILLFPYWFYAFFSDLFIYDLSFVSRFQIVMYPVIVALIFFLSLYWFLLISRGLLRALRIPAARSRPRPSPS